MRVFLSIVLLSIVVTASPVTGDEWKSISPLPDNEGFAGCFAGISHGALIVAGGANFPDKSPEQGGTKRWYDHVYVLESMDAKWKVGGKLPSPLGYGVSVTHRNGVVCVGGSDSRQHHSEVFRLECHDGQVRTTMLPSLPQSLANACGTLIGDDLYVIGGQTTPIDTESSKSMWRIDLSDEKARWEAMPELPGKGRILAVAATCADRLYVASGAALKSGADGKALREYLVDAYCFDVNAGWTRIADLPYAVTAAASPAPSAHRRFFVLSGDDGSQVGVSAAQHQGFSKQVLCYDVDQDRWVVSGRVPAPRVTLPSVRWGDVWVLPSGERLPGKRSPEVWIWKANQ